MPKIENHKQQDRGYGGYSPCTICGCNHIVEDYSFEEEGGGPGNATTTLYNAVCARCGAATGFKRSRDEAIDAWNNHYGITEIKSCPFCGSLPQLYECPDGVTVRCLICGAKSPWFSPEVNANGLDPVVEATKWWNRRDKGGLNA